MGRRTGFSPFFGCQLNAFADTQYLAGELNKHDSEMTSPNKNHAWTNTESRPAPVAAAGRSRGLEMARHLGHPGADPNGPPSPWVRENGSC